MAEYVNFDIDEDDHKKLRTLRKRIFWLLAFFCSVILSFWYIVEIWEKWNNSPVIVSFSDKSTRIWEIPFPAVTICSEMKVKRTLFNYSAAVHSTNRTESEINRLEYTSLVCDSNYSGNIFTDASALDNIEQVAPSLKEVIEHCRWRGEIVDCSHLFSAVMTDDGLCYTFNTLSAADLFTSITKSKFLNLSVQSVGWDPESGFGDSDALDTYPHRALSSGSNAGLAITLNTDNNVLDPLCRLPVHGFKMVLHNPSEFPQVQHQFFRVPLDREVVVGVKPRAITTSQGLRSYTPDRRQCFFSNERRLKFFRIYTQQNCELECLSNHTLSECGCLAYYAPRDDNSRICGSGSNFCIKCATVIFYITMEAFTKSGR